MRQPFYVCELYQIDILHNCKIDRHLNRKVNFHNLLLTYIQRATPCALNEIRKISHSRSSGLITSLFISVFVNKSRDEDSKPGMKPILIIMTAFCRCSVILSPFRSLDYIIICKNYR